MNRNKGYSGQSGYGSQTPERFPQQEWSGDDYREGHENRADRPYAGHEAHAETGRFGSSHDDVGQRPRSGVGEYYGPSRSGARSAHDEGFRPPRSSAGEHRSGGQERESWNLGSRDRYGNSSSGSASRGIAGQADYDEERYALQQGDGAHRGSGMQGMHRPASGYSGGVDRGYGGYGSGMPEQDALSGQNFSGRGPRGYTRSDERLKEDICEQLTHARDVDASDIQIEVEGGKVLLTGEVSERRMKHRAEDLVDRCSGVLEIENRLSVARSDKSTRKDTGSDASGASRAGGSAASRTTDQADAGNGNGNGHGSSARNGSPAMTSRKS